MSKQRKLRSKLSFDEEEDGDGAPPPPPPPGKKESSRPKKSMLLSFGDDEETALAPSKSKKDKSKTSKFHRANISSSTAAADVAATQKPATGEYTAEKLAALQAATQKLPSKFKPPPVAPSLDSAATAAAAAATGASPAGAIKLSGSFKNAAKAKDDRFSYSYSITGQISSSKDIPASKPPPAAAAAAAAAKERENTDDAMPLPPPPRPGSAAGKPAAASTSSIKAPTKAPAAAAAAAGGDSHGSDAESSDDNDSNGFLPDKETIRLAKAKRERLRQAHLAPDYVPLGGAGRLLGTAAAAVGSGPGRGLLGNRGLGPKSGVDGADEMDEDQGLGGSDNEGSEPGSDAEQELEERMRMTFVGQQQRGSSKLGASSSSKKGGAAAAFAGGHYASTVQDDHEHDDASDEDMAAAAAAGPEGQHQQRLAKAIRRNAGEKNRSWLAGSGGTAAAGAAGGIGDRTAAVQAAGAGVLSALMEATTRALDRQKHLEQNLSRTTANLTGALEEVERVRADIAATSSKYTTVQSLKAYLSDLADCLADKAILVEEMQDSLEQAREEAASAARQQERDDESILFAQAEAAVTAALAVLGRGGAAAAAAAAAETAAAEAEAAAVAAAATSRVEVDEFGRDMSLMRRKELEKGKSRRDRCVSALLGQLQDMRQGGRLNLDDVALQPAAAAATQPGSSSSSSTGSTTATSDDPEAVQQYKRRRQDILDLVPTVFADTDEQYASLTAVKTRLEGFKAQYPKEYGTAYIGESAAALFAPFVRLQLLQWEPMPIGSSSSSNGQHANGVPSQQQQQQQQPTGFDTQEWYQQLFEYGLAAAGAAAAAAAAADDADANLVPQLVESLVLPIALHLVARCWEPSNTAQSRAIAFIVSELFVYVPADKEDMAQLLALTTGTLESAVAAAAVPPWPAAAAAASPITQAVLQLRFRRAAALLQGLLGFSDLLSQQLMFKLALQGLVSQQLVPCLRSSFADLGVAVARAEAAVLALPAPWFKDGPVPQEARSLLDVLASLGRSIEVQHQKQQLDGGAAANGAAAAAVSVQALLGYAKRVAVLLLHVGLKEQAQRLSQLS